MNKKIIKKIKKYFKEEDKIISKAMRKVNYLMIPRGVDQNKEREELIDLRNKLLKDLEGYSK